MPLPYEVTTDLDIPADAFNADGIAIVNVQGGRYGGNWVIRAFVGTASEPAGEIESTYDLRRSDLTKDERYPDLAVDTVYVWLHDHVKKHACSFGADERPFFIAARALIGSVEFVPAPGVKYADEIPA